MKVIDIFDQGRGILEFEQIEVQADHTVAVVKAAIFEKHGFTGEMLVFIEGQDEPLEEHLIIGEVCRERSPKLHLHHCRLIETSVMFAGETVHHKFAPATTVGAIKNWAAIKKFHMTEAEAGEHLLQISGTKDRPAPGTHVGSLVHGHDCHVHFDLVPDERVNGAPEAVA
jgi:hypothetical protein